jgi:hypothetical protein
LGYGIQEVRNDVNKKMNVTVQGFKVQRFRVMVKSGPCSVHGRGVDPGALAATTVLLHDERSKV